jgi:hypothetical protein
MGVGIERLICLLDLAMVRERAPENFCEILLNPSEQGIFGIGPYVLRSSPLPVMTQPNILELAKQGDAKVIPTLLLIGCLL